MENRGADDHSEPPSQKKTAIPIRVIVTIFIFTGETLNFMMRVDMSVAIVSMVNNSKALTVASSDDESTCAELLPEIQNHTATWNHQAASRRTFDWDERTQARILGSFSCGWTVATFPCLYLVQRFGGKWPFGLSVFLSALCTLLVPVAAELGVGSLIATLALVGVAQGAEPASRNVLVSQWIPITERGRFLTFIICGMDVGVIIGMLGSGALADSNIFGGWPSIFYVFGMC